MRNPFEAKGRWLKSALHVHTSESDGEEPPPEVVSRYERGGWDVVCITDHWTVTGLSSSGNMLMIPGAELDAALPGGETDSCHILSLGVGEVPTDPDVRRRESFPSPSSAAAWILDKGGAPFLAHPYCSGVDPGVFIGSENVLGIEVFNAGYELESGCGRAEWFRDAVLASGRACSTIATDDSHDAPDCLNAWTMVRAEERSREAVVDALRAGSFYASNGPSILEARRDGDALEVRCSPARSVRLQSRPGSGSSVSVEYPSRSGRVVDTDPNGLITAARVQAEGDDLPWMLAEIVDLTGRVAWTNPL